LSRYHVLFCGHVSDVSGTNIFARVRDDREYLVYEMTFSSDDFYTQNKPGRATPWPRMFWMPSDEAASRYLSVARARGLVDGNAPCFQTSLVGTFPNSDIVVPI
jgi:hypothetical protein